MALPPVKLQPSPLKPPCHLAPSCPAAEEIEALWQEYEQGQTEEARLVKDFDKVLERDDRRCV